MGLDYWWVTRPKRMLNSIPEELAAFATVALGNKWFGNRIAHVAYEVELEQTGTKRIGERRDATGSGGRTHAAMLYSLGLWFEKFDKVFLTLAGEAILNGLPPVPVLKKQVLEFQYPSAYSDMRFVGVSPRFRIRPFVFLLRLLSDGRIGHLTQEEIAFVVALEAEEDTPRCFESVVSKILAFRNSSGDWRVFGEDHLSKHGATEANLMDIANTMMNWLDYTRLVYRERKTMGLDPAAEGEVAAILAGSQKLIHYPSEPDVFQRKYGVGPGRLKDTRNLLRTSTVSSASIERHRILKMFFVYSSTKPVARIGADVVEHVCNLAGTEYGFTESVLTETYPHGALGGYLSNFRNMAFSGRDEARDFEIATANLFRDVFHYDTVLLGKTGSKSTPDVLLVSHSDGYQAIIDNKAYSRYSITGDHHNRMVHNYVGGISNYSESPYPIGFFTYISGGFIPTIDSQIRSVADASGTDGSCITVANLISLVERHLDRPWSHSDLRRLFSLNRQILLRDLDLG